MESLVEKSHQTTSDDEYSIPISFEGAESAPAGHITSTRVGGGE